MLGDSVWKDALQLASRYTFLGSIISAIAAQHLYQLNPGDNGQRLTATRQVNHGLVSFRGALSSELTSTHIDAFVAASLLILHYLWADVDDAAYDSVLEASNMLPEDDLFAVSASLKQVFLKSVRLAPDQESTFMPHVSCDPTTTLMRAARLDRSSFDRFQSLFSHARPLSTAMLDMNFTFTRQSTDNDFDTRAAHLQSIHEEKYAETVARVCLLLSFMPGSLPPESLSTDDTLMQAAARFIVSFPIMCRGHFADLIRLRDRHAMLVLYHFYRAASALLPRERYWWAWKRAVLAQVAIERWLRHCIAGQVATGIVGEDSVASLDEWGLRFITADCVLNSVETG